jgi:hypothetical protein
VAWFYKLLHRLTRQPITGGRKGKPVFFHLAKVIEFFFSTSHKLNL